MLQSLYPELASTPSDINEHLPTFKRYAKECNSVTELGVRKIISLWAWLDSCVPVIRAYDLNQPPEYNIRYAETFAAENNIDFKFIQADVLQTVLEPTDLLFIDTWHIYPQLVQELHLHGEVARKFMMFHDTTLYARHGEDGSERGLQDALDEFLLQTDSWRVLEIFTNNNGLTILERI
jgi:hypothetical protein